MVQQSQKTLHVGGVILSSQGATIYSFDLEVFQPFSPTKCEPFPFCEKHVEEELLSSKRRGEEKGGCSNKLLVSNKKVLRNEQY